MQLSQIATPALVLDAAVLAKNEAAMASLLENKGLRLRPHYKSHKCAALARRQIENGAVGMTCAKLSEAEDLADAGVENILIANQLTDPEKIFRAALLAKKCRLCVCIDDAAGVRALADAAAAADSHIDCYVEYEIGMNRCGVRTTEEVIALARAIQNEPSLSFAGIQAYAGHLSHEEDAPKRAAAVQANSEKLRALLAALGEAGLPAAALSGGSTGTAVQKAEEDLYTELQAGSYLFMDATYRLLDAPFQNSLFLLTSVVSVQEGKVILDGGVKSLGVDQGLPLPVGFSAKEIAVHEEHVILYAPDRAFSVGEKVMLIPGHCCSTVNLHDKIYLVENEKVIDRLAVTARGCSR